MKTNELIEKALSSKAQELIELVKNVIEILRREETQRKKEGVVRLPTRGKLVVVGDLHSSLDSLQFILRDSHFLEEVKQGKMLLCLGDYGDRGEQAAEVYHVLLSLKKNFPTQVILLRGNHEFLQIPVWPHDLPFQLREKYGELGVKVYHTLRILFENLPHAAILERKYLFLHGGLPVNLTSIKDLAYAHRTYPQTTFLEEILWNDPQEIKGSFVSPRGVGRIFGVDVTKRALELLKVKTLIRTHEPCDGVAVNHEGMVLTLFSRKGAPYLNEQAAYLEIDLKERVKSAYELAKQARKF